MTAETRFQARGAGPDEPGAARAEEPLVAAGARRSRSPARRPPRPRRRSRGRRRRRAGRGRAPARRSLSAASASAIARIGQLDAGARVHPGDRDRARARRRRRAPTDGDDLVGRTRARVAVERDACARVAPVRARASGAAPRGWRRSRASVVRISWPARSAQAAVQQPEPHRRRVGQRDLRRASRRGRPPRRRATARFERDARARAGSRLGFASSAAAVALDRLAHRARMRREQERGQTARSSGRARTPLGRHRLATTLRRRSARVPRSARQPRSRRSPPSRRRPAPGTCADPAAERARSPRRLPRDRCDSQAAHAWSTPTNRAGFRLALAEPSYFRRRTRPRRG